jgi:hypothetical protein
VSHPGDNLSHKEKTCRIIFDKHFDIIMGVHIMLTIPLPVPLSEVKQHLVKPVLRWVTT